MNTLKENIKYISLGLVCFALIGVVIYQDKKLKEDPCVETAVTANIISKKVQTNGDIAFDVVVEGSDTVDHLSYASTTEKRVTDKIQVGKKMALCYVLK